MIYEAIDSVLLSVDDVAAAGVPYQRLGLRLSTESALPLPKTAGHALVVGTPANLFSVALLALTDVSALSPHQALKNTRGLAAVTLRVADLDATLTTLSARGIAAPLRTTLHGISGCVGDVAWLPLHDRAATNLVLLQPAHAQDVRHAAAVRNGALAHTFGLKRLDHLAAVTHDLEEKTRCWTDVLGVPVFGEVRTPTMIVRQLRIGDAILELLGPASPESPLGQRPPGLVSMASWEVENLDEVVSQARAAGFTVSEPAIGVLPGTRTATIAASELAGMTMQLLQYI